MSQAKKKRAYRKQAPTIFPPPSEHPFRAGPYIPPKLKVGSVVHDEYYGDVTFEGMTDAPIPWPGFHCARGRHKGLMPILCGGLVRAVIEEEETVVSHYWGVNRYMPNQWKRALAGCEDSNAVFAALAIKRADPAFRKKYGYK